MEKNQALFDKIEKVMKARVKETKLYLEEVDKIRSSDAWSDIEKTRQINALQEAHYKYGNDANELVSGVIAELATAAEEVDGNIDFISDTELNNAMKMIELTGGDVPEQLISNLNQKYRVYPQAVKFLTAFYKKYNIPVFDDDFAGSTSSCAARLQSIEDGFYYALAQENQNFSGLATQIDQLAQAMKCKFDAMAWSKFEVDHTRKSADDSSFTAKLQFKDMISQGIVF